MRKMDMVLRYLFAGLVVYAAITLCTPGNGSDPDAIAQDAGSGNCCSLTGPIQSVPADQDPVRLRKGGGSPNVGYSLTLTAGPMIVTDVSMDSDEGAYGLYVVSEGHTCSANGAEWVGGVSLGGPMHGARIWVPQGSELCAQYIPGPSIAANIGWAGFVPY